MFQLLVIMMSRGGACGEPNVSRCALLWIKKAISQKNDLYHVYSKEHREAENSYLEPDCLQPMVVILLTLMKILKVVTRIISTLLFLPARTVQCICYMWY